MTRRLFWLPLLALPLIAQQRPAVTIAGATAQAVFDLGGGSLVSFTRTDKPLNPLRWLGPADRNLALRPMAPFPCLDPRGPPSDAAIKAGMPFHGEATRVARKEDLSG